MTTFTTLPGFSNNDEYVNYCNDRFSFCIKYPKEFIAQNEADAQDGRTFISKDMRSRILAYGRLAIEDLDKLSQEFEFATKGIQVTYKKSGSDWFIFSAIEPGGNIIYQKTRKKKIAYLSETADTEVFQTLRISYPADQKNKYADYCKLISKSLP